MSASISLHFIAALVYSTLGVWLWSQAASPIVRNTLGAGQRVLLTLALASHSIAVWQGIWVQQKLYLGWAIALSAAVCLGFIVFWFQSLVSRIHGLLLILLPAATLVTLIAAAFPAGHLVPDSDNDWLRIHLIIAFTAYGLIFVAAAHAILMAALDRQLHNPVRSSQRENLWNKGLEAMPPLLVQEQLLFQVIRIGFVVLSLTVISGIIVSLRISSQLLPFDHKSVFTLLSWITFGVLLWGRQTHGWRGRIALRWTLVGFGFIVLAYTGSRFVLDVILS